MSALHKSVDRSPKVRVSTEQRAINCFEDEVSSRIRKDELRVRFKDDSLPPVVSRLFIHLNERPTIRSCSCNRISRVHL